MAELTSATTESRRALLITLILTLGYLIVEVAGGILANSLALVADAVHMLTDAGALALALFATWMSEKPATPDKTYGYYRVEILAALLNAVVLLLSTSYILYEAYRRFREPPEVIGVPMLIVAVVGLMVNLIGVWILRRGAEESLNVQAASLEVFQDALGSLGVIVAGLIILTTGWYYADPIASVIIGLLIFPRTWSLLAQAVNVLLEGTPAHISMPAVEQAMLSAEGVEAVHDVHVWTITSGMEAMSGHVVLADGTDSRQAQTCLEQIRRLLKEEFDIDHTTIQIEHRDLREEETQH